MGFEPTTVGFGVQRSTVGATPSSVSIKARNYPKTTLGTFVYSKFNNLQKEKQRSKYDNIFCKIN